MRVSGTNSFAVFAGMLNEMREGRLSQSSINTFRSLSRPLNFDDELDATELFALRSEVENANANRLVNLQGNVEVFEARDGGTIVDKGQRDKLLSNCMAPETITLKKGAQVMLIKNIDESLVNGSIGRVIGFMDEGEFDRYCINEEAYVQATDGVIGTQAPAAMSKEALARKRLTDNLTTARKYPLVRFAIADGTSRDLLCQPESWKVELPNGEVQASRSQVPLILAWALSIHKAQGQTLERVKVDLGKVFEKGQAYVALSRATSMAGLQVLRFDPRKVNAHERVGTFYANLARVELEGAGSKTVKSNPAAKPKGASLKAEDYEKSFVEDDWQEMP
jgi:ATP-dependent DNA helicase PIF1